MNHKPCKITLGQRKTPRRGTVPAVQKYCTAGIVLPAMIGVVFNDAAESVGIAEFRKPLAKIIRPVAFDCIFLLPTVVEP